MNHNIYSSLVVAEISRLFNKTPNYIFSDSSCNLTAYASREGRTIWPLVDGVIKVEINGVQAYKIAIEFKRENEGIHGLLTALGQAYAYLHKGYDASIIVIPKSYDTNSTPGLHLNEILKHTNDTIPIGIITYGTPDDSLVSPFEGKLDFVRLFDLNNLTIVPSRSLPYLSSKTQWVHLREGISTFSSFFRYLQISKQLNLNNLDNPDVSYLPDELIDAVNRIHPGQNATKYLSQTPNDSFSDYVWRHYWFKYMLNENNISIWTQSKPEYTVNDAYCSLELSNGSGYKKFFVGRSNSIKNILVNELNQKSISENEAWDRYAKKLHGNAHSYKETIDSGLEHLRLLKSDGKPTDIGYKYVDACERNSEIVFSGSPKSIIGTILLNHGELNVFLHYIFKLSNKKFKDDPLAFTYTNPSGKTNFNSNDYINWLSDELSNNLCVMKKSTQRGGKPRKPFQAEFAMLRKFGIVGSFRIGLGIEINWPLVQKYVESEI